MRDDGQSVTKAEGVLTLLYHRRVWLGTVQHPQQLPQREGGWRLVPWSTQSTELSILYGVPACTVHTCMLQNTFMQNAYIHVMYSVEYRRSRVHVEYIGRYVTLHIIIYFVPGTPRDLPPRYCFNGLGCSWLNGVAMWSACSSRETLALQEWSVCASSVGVEKSERLCIYALY